MAQVIVFPRGQLSELDRARMEEVGIVAVEAEDPQAVVTVIPGAPLATEDDLAMAALAAVCKAPLDGVGMHFARVLHRRLEAREAVSAAPTQGADREVGRG